MRPGWAAWENRKILSGVFLPGDSSGLQCSGDRNEAGPGSVGQNRHTSCLSVKLL